MNKATSEPNRVPFLVTALLKTLAVLAAVLLVIVVLFGWFKNTTTMIYYMRVPILASAILLFLGMLVTRQQGIRQLLGNLFVLAGPIQLASVFIATFIYANAILLIFDIIWQAGPTRFGFEPPSYISWLVQSIEGVPVLADYSFFVLSLLLSLPILLVTIKRTRKEVFHKDKKDANKENTADEQPRRSWIVEGIFWGIVVIIVLSVMSNLIYNVLSRVLGISAVSEFLLSNQVVAKCNCWEGYTEPFTELHFRAMAFLVVGILLYLFVGNLYHPRPPFLARTIQRAFLWFLTTLESIRSLFRRNKSNNLTRDWLSTLGTVAKEKNKPIPFHAAALFYVLVLLTSLTLFLGSLTFLFDYIMVPIILALGLFSFLMSRIFKTKNKFPVTFKAPYAATNDEALCKVLNARLRLQKENRTCVIVCLKGGGIHSAGWGVRVLTGLNEELGEPFSDAIGIVSGVSGGAVGTMHYVNHIANKEDSLSGDRVFRDATADSLDAAAWGILYLDFWRFIGLPFLIFSDRDRGWAIEEDWKLVMGDRAMPTLEKVKEKVETGEVPIPILNATVESDGNPLFFSPVKIPICTSEANAEKFNFVSLLKDPEGNGQEPDLDVATAARLSAAFPYVSPISCNNQGAPEVYLADGGYFDNFAMYSAVNFVEWLQSPHKTGAGEFIPADDRKGYKTNAEIVDLDNVLLISVRAFPVEKSDPASGSNWMMSLLGPINIVMAARSSTQGEHMQKEVDLLEQMVRRTKDHHTFNIETVNVEYPGGLVDPPLSWKLSPKEKQSIKDAWKKYTVEEEWGEYKAEHEDPEALENPVRRIKEIWAKWKQPEVDQQEIAAVE